MRAGQLNNRVTLRQPVTAQDAVGQSYLTWTDLATVWANVKHLSGVSSIQGDADISTVKASIRIRYRAGLNAGMRAVVGTNVYDIKAVLMDMEGKEYTDLVCQLVT
jgi:SPP1 family predicted phage head-tail adaptor